MVLRHQIFCLIGWFIVAGKGKRSFLVLHFIGKRSFLGSFFIGKRSSNEKNIIFAGFNRLLCYTEKSQKGLKNIFHQILIEEYFPLSFNI